MINLSKIDKSLITKNNKGESVVWVDILSVINGPDQYGNTHTMTMYNKDTKATTYLGNFRPQEFGKAAGQAPSAGQDGDNDLPF